MPRSFNTDPEPTGAGLLELLRSCAASGEPERPDEASVDGQAAGLAALVELRLDRQGAEHVEAFEQRALADAAVQQVWRVSPGPDFVLVVHCADMADYHALTKRLFRQKWNVRNVKARFALRRARAPHSRGRCRSRPRSDALQRPPETDPARYGTLQVPSKPRWAWPGLEHHAFDADAWPVEPGLFASSASRHWLPRLRRPAHAAVVAVDHGTLSGFQVPHFFVVEVRALAA